MDFVGRGRIPDDELAVLGGRDEVTNVGGPMHGIDFGEVTAKVSASTHDDARKGFDFSCDGTDWRDI